MVGLMLAFMSRHPYPQTVSRTIRVLNNLMIIVSKSTKRDRFEVSVESVAYLTALLHVCPDVRLRCHLRAATVHALTSNSDLAESLRQSSMESGIVGANMPETSTSAVPPDPPAVVLAYSESLGSLKSATSGNDNDELQLVAGSSNGLTSPKSVRN